MRNRAGVNARDNGAKLKLSHCLMQADFLIGAEQAFCLLRGRHLLLTDSAELANP
jgi:hypothetical protein